MSNKKIQLVLLIAISLLVGYFFGKTQVSFELKNYHPHVSFLNLEPPAEASTVDMKNFSDVWNTLTQKYYDRSKLDQQKMINGAISGLVGALGDPYTMYLPPTQQNNFQQQLAGQFGGIGAELGLTGKQIVVIAPLAGTPAEKAGIKAGDLVLGVDGQSTATWNLEQTVEKIRGKKGTDVTLTIQHKDAKDKQDIKITRDTITVKSVDGFVKSVKDIASLPDSFKSSDKANTKIMYVRLAQFGDNTNKDWTALVTKLKSQGGSDVKGMILDLRDNPGGYLQDATYVAGTFLPEGTPVVSQQTGADKNTLSVNRQGELLDIPLVVLINRGSASASEIVSGALRDNKRAKLVGDKSFGKGTVQEALDLGAGSGMHVTIAKWLTPNGTWVHGVGLTPDVSVALDPKDPTHDIQLQKAIETLLQ